MGTLSSCYVSNRGFTHGRPGPTRHHTHSPVDSSHGCSGHMDIDLEDPEVPADVAAGQVEPQPLPQPLAPTEEERQRHEPTHAESVLWCQHCVAGKINENKPARRSKHENSAIAVILVDHSIFAIMTGSWWRREVALQQCPPVLTHRQNFRS